MSFNWHDFYGVFENRERSKIVGKVKTALMPSGPAGSRNYYSGAALAINATIPEKYQKASTPVRKSAYEDPEVKEWIRTGEYPGAAIAKTMLEAWKPENLEFVEGRFPQFVESLIVQYTELSYMLQGKKTPEQTMKDIVKQTNDITGYTKLMKAAGQ